MVTPKGKPVMRSIMVTAWNHAPLTVTALFGPLWIRSLVGGALLLILALLTPTLAGTAAASGSAASMALGMELIAALLGLILVIYSLWLVATGQHRRA